jgi:hypothetical protein
MCDLMYDCVPDDCGLSSGRDGHALDGATEDADAIWKVRLLRAALGEGNAFVETEERPAFRNSLPRRLVLDHYLQIPDAIAELSRQLVQRVSHQACKARTPQVGHDRNLRKAGKAGKLRRARRSHAGECPCSQAAHAGLREPDLAADLA